MTHEIINGILFFADICGLGFCAYMQGKIRGSKECRKIMEGSMDKQLRESMQRVIAEVNANAGVNQGFHAELIDIKPVTKH
jgi:hypothetical protein